MASSSEVAKRRQAVGDLWLRGVPVLRIATMLNTPHRTIRSDVEHIRGQLQQERLESLEARRDRSIATLRKVQMEAWALFHRVSDTSTNKASALSTIHDCEQTISKLEGVLGTDISMTQITNIIADPQWIEIRSAMLSALLPFPEARVAVAEAMHTLEGPREH